MGYVLTNGTLFMHQHYVGDVLKGSYLPHELNGSLWTLFYEFGAYLCVALLGVLGLLTRRPMTVVCLAIACYVGLAWYTVDPHGFTTTLHSPYLLSNASRLGLMFAIGMCFRLWNERIIMDDRLAVASLALFLASAPLKDWHLLGAVPFAYFVLWLAARLPLADSATT